MGDTVQPDSELTGLSGPVQSPDRYRRRTTQCGANDEVTRRAKDGRKPGDGQRMPGAGLSWTSCWEAPSERPAFEPYWGKLAVRNDRGDRGNVGIIRSPVRASILPDAPVMSAPGTTRNRPGRALTPTSGIPKTSRTMAPGSPAASLPSAFHSRAWACT